MGTCEAGKRTGGPSGFSMVELIVVLSLVLMFSATVTVTAMTGSSARAQTLGMRQQAFTVEIASRAYRARHGTYPRRLADLYADDLLVPGSVVRVSAGHARLVLTPSAPGRRDVAAARVVEETGRDVPEATDRWGWER